MIGDGKWAVATLEQGEAERNPKGTGTAVAVKKGGRHRPFPVPPSVPKRRAAAG